MVMIRSALILAIFLVHSRRWLTFASRFELTKLGTSPGLRTFLCGPQRWLMRTTPFTLGHGVWARTRASRKCEWLRWSASVRLHENLDKIAVVASGVAKQRRARETGLGSTFRLLPGNWEPAWHPSPGPTQLRREEARLQTVISTLRLLSSARPPTLLLKLALASCPRSRMSWTIGSSSRRFVSETKCVVLLIDTPRLTCWMVTVTFRSWLLSFSATLSFDR